MGTVYLLLGSNSKDKFEKMTLAKSMISKQVGFITKESSLYKTESWGFQSNESFLNQVIMLASDLSPYEILEQTLLIEESLGRRRGKKRYDSRSIDVDILFHDDRIIRKKDLEIPHPRMHLRRFTLIPLKEIAGSFIHPYLGKPIKQLLDECKDTLRVELFDATKQDTAV